MTAMHSSAQAWHKRTATFDEKLRAAANGPWFGVVYEQAAKSGFSRDLWRCRHRHRSVEDALACANAWIAEAAP